jgi:hypothetical protein
MTKDLLIQTGRALYGERWQSPLARDLGVDSRRVRAWCNDERPVPDLKEMLKLLLMKRVCDIELLISGME